MHGMRRSLDKRPYRGQMDDMESAARQHSESEQAVNWSPSVRKRVRALVEAIASLDVRQTYCGVDVITIQDAIPKAGALLDFLRERKPPAKRLPGEARKAKRERKKREHREATAAIREAVFKRAGGRCEKVYWAASENLGRCVNEPTELHHLRPGVGRRRKEQSVETCVAYCFACHRAAHRASKKGTP